MSIEYICTETYHTEYHMDTRPGVYNEDRDRGCGPICILVGTGTGTSGGRVVSGKMTSSTSKTPLLGDCLSACSQVPNRGQISPACGKGPVP